jgi:NAD(P)H dehydrogenase (quinone)
MIAITGANGNLGKATISFLLKKTDPSGIVAVVRDAAKMQDYAGSGIQVRVADYNDAASLRNAFQGIDKVLQISTAGYGEQAKREESSVVQAASDQGVQHIVYTSTLHPGENAHFLAARTCMNTENAIKAAGMQYTIFRNSMYFETIPLFIGGAMENGQVYYPGGNGTVSFAYRPDIAEALSNVLASGEHKNAVYNITGSGSYGFGDIAGLLRTEKGMDASYTDIPNEAYREELVKYEIPAAEIDFYESMAVSIKAGEFSHVDDTLEKLLQRKRFSIQEYIKSI